MTSPRSSGVSWGCSMSNVIGCYHCGKIVRGEVIHHVPSILSERLGCDFARAYHPACYREAEILASNRSPKTGNSKKEIER